jgi:hypothetical protein
MSRLPEEEKNQKEKKRKEKTAGKKRKESTAPTRVRATSVSKMQSDEIAEENRAVHWHGAKCSSPPPCSAHRIASHAELTCLSGSCLEMDLHDGSIDLRILPTHQHGPIDAS